MADKADKITTPYVVLYRIREQTGQGWTELVADGALHIVHSRGAEQAIRDGMRESELLGELASQGEGIDVLVVPQRSYNPVPVRLVPQEPVIKIGS